MALKAVAVAVAILGIPLSVVAPAFVYHAEISSVRAEAESLGRVLDRYPNDATKITHSIRSWLGTEADNKYIRVDTSEGLTYVAGARPETPVLTGRVLTSQGLHIRVDANGWPTVREMIVVVTLIIFGCIAAAVGAWVIAKRESRRLAAPLIYLAAQAEQIGSGLVQARVSPSGIEEIDLVQEELVRSNKQLAGRIAKERQFASDASHQLRTPLTALSMRLEEIEMIAEDEAVRTEATACLEQVERLTDIVQGLLTASRQQDRRNTEAISITSVFDKQKDEWQEHFDRAKRELRFINNGNRTVVATPASLGQALATLIENSLKYGEGCVTVEAKDGVNKRMVTIEVSDEGKGISDDDAAQVFRRGFSTHDSTGIGLALAKSLVEADGGWIRLIQNSPPIFAIGLPALPDSVDPNKVIPTGSIVNVGRRNRAR